MTTEETADSPLDAEALRRLAVSDNGFVFDPVSGTSYTLNATGLAILRLLQRGLDTEEISAALQKQYAVNAMTAQQEVAAFTVELRGHFR